MSQPLPLEFRYLPAPVQRAIEQFAGLPRMLCTPQRLASLLDGHLEAHGLSDDARLPGLLTSALTMARRRFGIDAERRRGPRDAACVSPLRRVAPAQD